MRVKLEMREETDFCEKRMKIVLEAFPGRKNRLESIIGAK